MILGVGVDLVEIARIAEIRERQGERFEEKLFTPDEMAYCKARKNTDQHLAARFAAKEACMKAFGTGCAEGIGFKTIEVVRADNEAPKLRLHGPARERAEKIGATRLHLSLSHTDDHAIAYVVLESDS